MKINTEVEIDCEASAVPEPKIKIQQLSASGELERQFEQRTLRYNSTKATKRFRCLAENELGSIHREITVKNYGNHFSVFISFFQTLLVDSLLKFAGDRKCRKFGT